MYERGWNQFYEHESYYGSQYVLVEDSLLVIYVIISYLFHVIDR